VGDDTIGFITCLLDQSSGLGTIDLVGVALGQRAKGVGKQLVAAALRWFSEHAKRVRVKTQVTNYVAASIYVAAGFRLRQSDLAFSKVLDEE
jgi:GNAT superfamily N-acetyltransferase